MMDHLVQTKLFIPPVRPTLVPRLRMIQKLNTGMGGKLTLICAPAGFGKTTLVTAWIEQTEQPTAWLSLDENDSDLVRFLTYFVAALQTVDEGLGETAASLLQSPQPPQIEHIFTSLINELAQKANHITMVLDDYHLIQDKAIHNGLAFLLEHMPPQLHLIITTRANPPLPLAKLRASGQMTEIRVRSLRFSVDEVAVLFNTQLSHNLNKEDLLALTERTEGWITGLQLAAISLQEQAEPTTFIQSFTGSNQYILDYLLEEVLQQQPTEIQHFLLQTSVLQRLTADLCNQLTGETDGQTILELLQKKNLFIIALDDERRWFRYHHLFADLLLHRLQRTQPTQPANLHKEASVWYEAHGLITEALYHARTMGDYARAVQLISRNSTPLAYQGESTTVFAWVNSMPLEQIRATPLLSIIKAWEALYLMQVPAIEQHLTIAEAALQQQADEPETRTLYAEILTLRGWAVLYRGDSKQAIQVCRQALTNLPAEEDHARSLVLGTLAASLLAEGQMEESIAASLDALEAYQKVGNWLASLDIVLGLSNIYLLCGQLRQAESFLGSVADRFPEDMPAEGLIYCALGSVAYEKDQLETAVSYFQQVLTTSQRKTNHLDALRYLVKIYVAMGQPEQAKTAFQEAEMVIKQWLPSLVKTELPVLTVQFALLQQDVATATQSQQQFGLTRPASLTYQSELEALTLARLWIAQGRDSATGERLTEAVGLLTQIEETAVSAKRFARAAEAQLLCAVALDSAGQSEEALTLLTEPLRLAEVEGYRRLFLDEGPPVAKLLRQLPQTPLVSELLTGFRFPRQDKLPINQAGLVEPLSERELKVLRLVIKRLTYREIADELIVSLNTVRYHMKNIYTKLGVNKRVQAIERAKKLNLLE